MSEPKRYCLYSDGRYIEMKEHEKGGYVRHIDYAQLEAEAERYRLASLRVDVGELHAQFNKALFDETLAENAGLKAESFNGNLLHEPHLVKTLAGNPFQVFTPFWKNCLANLKFGIPLKAPKKLSPFEKPLKSVDVAKLGLLPKIKWDTAFPKYWDPTRKGAEKRLKDFVAARAAAEQIGRAHV